MRCGCPVPGPPKEKGPMSNRPLNAQILCSDMPPISCASEGVSCSIDSIRVKWTYPAFFSDPAGNLVDSCEHVYKRLCDPDNVMLSVMLSKRSYKIGTYAFCITLRDDSDHSATVLIGRYGPNQREPYPEAVLDVNPAKCDSSLVSFIVRSLSLGSDSPPSVVRYDLAIDLPLPRDQVYLLPENGRHYCKIVNSDHAMTEYIGRRQHHGYIKLYDKTAEASLDRIVTRLELTIDFDHEIPRFIPNVVIYDNGVLDDDPVLVQCMILHPDLIPLVKSRVSRNTWSSYKKLLAERQVVGWSFEPEFYEHVCAMVLNFFSWLSVYGLF